MELPLWFYGQESNNTDLVNYKKLFMTTTKKKTFSVLCMGTFFFKRLSDGHQQ